MRIRHKPWAKPEIAASPFCMDDAFALRGAWRQQFARPDQPFYVELGCGKGGWVSEASALRPENNYLAFDIKDEMLGMAKRKIEARFRSLDRSPDNVRLSILNIERISEVLSMEDGVDRIYINFCNPWPKPSHKKRRLTHPRQLIQYQAILRGELHFKTDDDDLFRESLVYFTDCGWDIRYQTTDLHAEEPEDNIRTEHEQMFTKEGKKIKFLIAKPPVGEAVLPEQYRPKRHVQEQERDGEAYSE